MPELPPRTDAYTPDGAPIDKALKNTAYMALVAHQDDAEIAAYDGIRKGLEPGAPGGFSCVIITDGAGSPKTGMYAGTPSERMAEIRREEQRKAARRGEYRAAIQLGYSSASIKPPPKGQKGDETRDARLALVKNLKDIIHASHPKVLYLHSPFDKHETHQATTAAALMALKELHAEEPGYEPQVLGVEVWRKHEFLVGREASLDDPHLVRAFLTEAELKHQETLIDCFPSQNEGAKPYPSATIGHARSNATFDNPHASSMDTAGIMNMVDLSPIVRGEVSQIEYVRKALDRFTGAVMDVAERYTSDVPIEAGPAAARQHLRGAANGRAVTNGSTPPR